MTGDLHCHTKLSDGSMGIDDLIVLAQKCNVDTLAITDLDCLAGTVRAKLIGERHGIKVIQGVELSSYDSTNECEVNILGYQCESPDRLEGLCHRNLVARKRAAQYMMIKASQRFPITPDLVLKCAQGSTNVYPVHIMAALAESGLTTSLYGDLYDELFNAQSENGIYVRAKFSEPADVIQAIHDAGGIAVCAHPGVFGSDAVLDDLIDAGLDGIEVWCPQHNDDMVEKYLTLAKKHKLVATGGSGFRGRNNSACVTLGSYTTPETSYNDFVNYKARVRRQQKATAKAKASE